MYGSLDISTSGMIAQRTRLTAISANIANQGSYVRGEDGQWEPYRRRMVMFAPGDPSSTDPSGRGRGGMGVHVADIELDQSPFEYEYNPDSPYAITKGTWAGYVARSNVDPVTEQVNAMEAMRSYEANVAAAEATKSMMAQALRLIA